MPLICNKCQKKPQYLDGLEDQWIGFECSECPDKAPGILIKVDSFPTPDDAQLDVEARLCHAIEQILGLPCSDPDRHNSAETRDASPNLSDNPLILSPSFSPPTPCYESLSSVHASTSWDAGESRVPTLTPHDGSLSRSSPLPFPHSSHSELQSFDDCLTNSPPQDLLSQSTPSALLSHCRSSSMSNLSSSSMSSFSAVSSSSSVTSASSFGLTKRDFDSKSGVCLPPPVLKGAASLNDLFSGGSPLSNAQRRLLSRAKCLSDLSTSDSFSSSPVARVSQSSLSFPSPARCCSLSPSPSSTYCAAVSSPASSPVGRRQRKAWESKNSSDRRQTEAEKKATLFALFNEVCFRELSDDFITFGLSYGHNVALKLFHSRNHDGYDLQPGFPTFGFCSQTSNGQYTEQCRGCGLYYDSEIGSSGKLRHIDYCFFYKLEQERCARLQFANDFRLLESIPPNTSGCTHCGNSFFRAINFGSHNWHRLWIGSRHFSSGQYRPPKGVSATVHTKYVDTSWVPDRKCKVPSLSRAVPGVVPSGCSQTLPPNGQVLQITAEADQYTRSGDTWVFSGRDPVAPLFLVLCPKCGREWYAAV